MTATPDCIPANNKYQLLQKILCFFLAFTSFMAVPYSRSIAFDWFIQLPGSYKISLFNLVEIISFTTALFIIRLRILSGIERRILIALLLVMATRVISLLFAKQYETIQYFSILRFAEVLLGLIILTNLLQSKSNRKIFIVGLTCGLLIECFLGLNMVIQTGGHLRGIFFGIPSYQMMVLFILFLFLLTKSQNLVLIIFAINILLTGIMATQTRAALIQLAVGMIAVIIIAYKQSFFKRFTITLVAVTIVHSITLYFMQSVISAAKDRFEDAIKEGKIHLEEDEHSVGGGTIQYRLYLWDKSIGAFLSRPVTGIGSGSFARQLDSLPQKFGVKLDRLDKSTPLSTHNTFLGVLAETGLVGFAAYFFWIASVVGIILKYYRSNHFHSFASAVAIMLCIFIFSDFWSQQSFLPNMTYLTAFLLAYLRDTIKPGAIV
ncbi:MAG TPA: O-antigen ligase family protein [Bacteroidia bacterium]|nr:O-antigen ligase family protein [Bacteroidia bacterium]